MSCAAMANQQERRPDLETEAASEGLAFGEYDFVLVCQMPNNVSAAAFSMAASAGGAVKAVKTTPLMTIDEAMEAMRKASGAGYRPPDR